MKSKSTRYISLIIILLLALASIGASSLPQISNIILTNVVFTGPNCTVSFDTSFDYAFVNSNYGIHAYAFGDGNYAGYYGDFSSSNLPSGSFSRSVNMGGVTGSFQECTLQVDYVADDMGLYSRIVVGAPTASQGSTPWFYTPLSASELVTGNHQMVLYDGVEACGIFDAGWYGRKYITPENFPGCADYLPDGVEVACMNEEAIWTADNVTGSGVSEGVFYAIVQQHGTCGIFPAG